MTDLSRKRDRDRLAKDPNPYWQRLAKGQYLGWRSTSGAWIARYGEKSSGRMPSANGKLKSLKGKQHYHVLDGVDRDDFDGAKQAAEAWLSQMGAAGGQTVKRGTVLDALSAYVADLKEQGRKDTATELESRFKTTVAADVIAAVPLESLTKETFRLWRKRLGKGRQPRSVNRQVRAVVAGLNHAVKELSHIGNPAVWTLKLLPDDKEDGGEATAVFLDADRRAAIIGAAEPHAADFFRGLEFTGARPRELAAAVVRDFDGRMLTLSHRKGRSSARKIRHFELDDKGAAFFAKLVEGRPESAPIFCEDNEGKQPWRRHRWVRAFNAAVTEAKVPDEGSTYSFRHAAISEFLQIHRIDPLVVAAQTGTSLVMIERTYLKYIPTAMREKMQALKS